MIKPSNVPLLCLFILCLAFSTVVVASITEADHKLPVVFVHGHGLQASDWDEFRRYFTERAYLPESLYAVSIAPNTEKNIIAARKYIKPAVAKLLRKSGKRKVNIVAHSMGAVSARWYAKEIGSEYINALVSIAGSNHGTNALCAYNDAAAREMCPAYSDELIEDSVQVLLNGVGSEYIDETPYGRGLDREGVSRLQPDHIRSITYWTIRISNDQWIEPAASAMLDGAGDDSVKLLLTPSVIETSPGNYLFEGLHAGGRAVDHCSVLEHPEVMKLVLNIFQQADKVVTSKN